MTQEGAEGLDTFLDLEGWRFSGSKEETLENVGVQKDWERR